MLYMFRTLLVHHQEQLCKLYIAFGICRYVWMLRGYSHTTARPPNSFYTFTVLCLRTWENVLMICFFIEPSKLFYQYYTVRATCKNNEKEVERSWLVSALWSSDARRRKCDALSLSPDIANRFWSIRRSEFCLKGLISSYSCLQCFDTDQFK